MENREDKNIRLIVSKSSLHGYYYLVIFFLLLEYNISVINNSILLHFLHTVFTIWWDTYTYIFYKFTMVHDGPVIQIYTYILYIYIVTLLFI